MRIIRLAAAGVLFGAAVTGAQQPDSASRSRTRADSIAKAVQDSIALMKALGAAMADTTRAAAPATPTGPQTGPTNPRLLPDVSAVGDLVGDLSPKGSTQADGTRFSVREVELAVQAVVDPYFRGDVFLGMSDLEGLSIEQAYLTTTALPNQLELRLGRFLMPFGKQNTTHRHDLHTIEYPYVIQRFLSDDGLKGTGVWGSRVFAPFGFYQELQVTAVDRLGDRTEGLVPYEDENKALSGLGFSARLRNYVDINESTNFELSFSAMTGRRAQPLDSLYSPYFQNGVNAVLARQSTLGTDLTYRWRPLQQGLYKSFILQAEVMRQLNERRPGIPASALVLPGCASCNTTGLFPADVYAGPTRDYTGAYVFARYQTTQRSFLGTRYDYVQDPERAGGTLNAGSVYLEWFPSEFSKLVAGYELAKPAGEDVLHRLLVQATFALGPHKPHPF
jgi:hypothetical protein